MSKDAVPLMVAEMTPFARTLSKQLHESEGLPSHLALLNMLARAAGFRNYQHMRASHAAKGRLDAPGAGAVDYRRVERCLNHFDAQGRLIRWPSKRHMQELCLWVLWAQLPRKEVMQERDVNGALNKGHLFDDAALLRRSLVGMKLLSRNRDGSDYRRVEHSPKPEAVAVIRQVAARRKVAL